MYDILPKKILISGFGSIGRRYCRLIQQNWPSIQIAALRSGHSRNRGNEENALTNSFRIIDEALAWKPEAAIIASPASVHIEQSLPLAKFQIPLLIEKPVGTGYESSHLRDQLLTLSVSSPIYVGYVLRQDPCAALIRNKVLSSELGRLISADFYCGSWLPDWRPGQDYRKSVSASKALGGGALLELSHEVDMAEWLMGPLTPINALLHHSGSLEMDAEDQAYLLFRNNQGVPISIRLDLCTNPATRVMSLRFTSGELQWDLIEGIVSYTDANNKKSISSIGLSADERFLRQLALFWQCPKPGQSSLGSLEEGLNVLDMLVKSRQLAAN